MSGCTLCDQAMHLCWRLINAQNQTTDPVRRSRIACIGQRAMWRFQARWYLHRQVCALEYKERTGSFPPWDILMRLVMSDSAHHARYGYQLRAAKLYGGGR